MNRSGWKGRTGGKQCEGCGLNVPGRNIVRDIDDFGCGIAGENYPLDRRDEVVRAAEVSEQGDDRDSAKLKRRDMKTRRLLTRLPRLCVSAFGFHLVALNGT